MFLVFPHEIYLNIEQPLDEFAVLVEIEVTVLLVVSHHIFVVAENIVLLSHIKPIGGIDRATCGITGEFELTIVQLCPYILHLCYSHTFFKEISRNDVIGFIYHSYPSDFPLRVLHARNSTTYSHASEYSK